MAGKSNIEWTDASWTPIRARHRETGKVGWHCEHATTGCVICYSEAMNKRLGTGLPFKPGHRKDIEIFLDDKMLLAPLHWRKPRMIFVCSMTDLFADFVRDEWIDRVFAVMALAPQHTFQVLTKRSDRMRAYLTKAHAANFTTILDDGRAIPTPSAHVRAHAAMCDLLPVAPPRAINEACAWQDMHYPGGDGFIRRWPLPNVWLGVSAERQEEANERIPHLLQTPAVIRFVSCEPLLGPIDLTKVRHQLAGESFMISSALQGDDGFGLNAARNRLDWVIVGGESGKDARPMHPGWARSLRDQCETVGVSFFFKQWGSWEPYQHTAGGIADVVAINGALSRGDELKGGPERHPRWCTIRNVGKKAAGRLLDGQSHNDMPGRVG